MIEYWLIIAGVAAFVTCLTVSLVLSGRMAGGLEKELIRLKIRMDMLETSNQVSTSVVYPKTVPDQDISSKTATTKTVPDQDSKDRPVEKPESQIRYGNIIHEVLKIVSNGPKTARQIQGELGQSREHVARTVKKMSDGGYLTRIDSRPFVYTITSVGHRILDEDSGRDGTTEA